MDGHSLAVAAGGLAVTFAAYAAAFLIVLNAPEAEPMAPIVPIVASLWIAIGLIVAVWPTGRVSGV